MASSELQQILKKYKICEKDRHPYDVLSHEVFIVDRHLEIVYADQKKIRKYGPDIIGQKCYEVFPRRRDCDKPCPNCPCVAIFGDTTRNSSRNERFETVDEKGKPRYLSETAVPLHNDAGERILAIVIGRNITKRVMLENIKKDFYGILGSEYGEHLRLVADGLGELGYARVRLYDVMNDFLSPDNPLFVLRAKSGCENIDIGYSFHLYDEGFKEVLPKLVGKEFEYSDETPICIDELTEAKLLKDEKFSPDNKCIIDLGLKNTPWILLPLFSQAKSDSSEKDTKTSSKKKLVGLLSVDNKGAENPVTNDDLVLLKNFADFLGEAITAVRAEMNLHILNKISELITQKRQDVETHDLIAREVCENMEAGMCSIFIFSDIEQKLERHANYISSKVIPGGDFKLDFKEDYEQNSPYLTSKAFSRGEVLNVLSFDDIKKANPNKRKEYEDKIGQVHWSFVTKYEDYIVRKTGKRYEIKNAIFAPLKFEDHNIGVIRVVNNHGEGCFPFPNSDIDLLNSIALQIAAHSHYEGMKSELDHAISGISRAIAEQKFDLHGIAQSIVSTVRQMSKAFAVTLFLKDDGKRTLKSIAKEGYPDTFEGELEYSLNGKQDDERIGITAKVALTGEPFASSRRGKIINEASHSGKYENQLYKDKGQAESLIAVPMKMGNHVIGVLKVEDYEQEKFGPSFRTMFDIMADLASMAIYSIQEIERRNDLMLALGHELAAPATAIAALGNVMIKRYSIQENILPGEETLTVRRKKLYSYCKDIVAEGSHLTFLTSSREALHTYTNYNFGYSSLKALLWEVIYILEPHANWKYMDINFDKDSIRGQIEMDRSKLKQAIYNLIYNSIKYSERNQTINVLLSQQGGHIVLKIQDYGVGVPEGEEHMIFEKESRGSNAADKDPTGMGLGLYYTRLIIEGHQGHISLTNRKDPTEFLVMLPLKQQQED